MDTILRMKLWFVALLEVALSVELAAQERIPPECQGLAHPLYDDCIAASKEKDREAAEREFRALPAETQQQVRSLGPFAWDGATTESLHSSLAALKRLNDDKLAKEKSAQARKKSDADAIRRNPDKDPQWLVSKAGRLWRDHPSWSVSECNSLAARKVWIGMSTEQAVASWGKPESINTDVSASGATEQWVYGANYLYVVGGKVTYIQTHR